MPGLQKLDRIAQEELREKPSAADRENGYRKTRARDSVKVDHDGRKSPHLWPQDLARRAGIPFHEGDGRNR